jgi:predicted regulator of Ras-like GTPase activity (Roadblock/LC7/MglB family)
VAAVEETWSGGREFEALQQEMRALGAERGIVGAVMLDAQGYVVAGEMRVEERDLAPEIAAILSGTSSEAERAVRHLKLGAWKGILVETPEAVVRIAPTGDGGMVAVAGRREVPTGWVLRVAARARDAALRFLAALGGGGAG